MPEKLAGAPLYVQFFQELLLDLRRQGECEGEYIAHQAQTQIIAEQALGLFRAEPDRGEPRRGGPAQLVAEVMLGLRFAYLDVRQNLQLGGSKEFARIQFLYDAGSRQAPEQNVVAAILERLLSKDPPQADD